MSKTIGIAILAAGEGTRLKLNYSKPLAPLCGRRIVDFPVCESLKFFESNSVNGFIGMITGHKREELESYLKQQYSDKLKYCVQEKQIGTADALKSYFEGIDGSKDTDYTVVLCADTPLIREKDLTLLLNEIENDKLDGVAAVFETSQPKGYGRIVCGHPGFHIVEEKDADEETKKIKFVNSGLYIFKTEYIKNNLNLIDSNNNAGEFYLTDLFQDDRNVKALNFDNAKAFMGVNTQQQLSEARHLITIEKNLMLQEQGVFIIDFRHTYIDYDVEIGEGSVIHPHSYIYSGTSIGRNTEVEPGCVIRNTIIENDVLVKAYSYFEDAIIRNEATIGPFARIRPSSDIGEKSKIGNFVETKKVKFHEGVKVSHLSYVGDAEVGENTNIGCGFITCNYDGANKHKTVIGKNAFIGSDSQTVAPVNIGDGAYIGSGSTINKDVPSEAFAIARARQVTKEGMAKKFKKSKT